MRRSGHLLILLAALLFIAGGNVPGLAGLPGTAAPAMAMPADCDGCPPEDGPDDGACAAACAMSFALVPLPAWQTGPAPVAEAGVSPAAGREHHSPPDPHPPRRRA